MKKTIIFGLLASLSFDGLTQTSSMSEINKTTAKVEESVFSLPDLSNMALTLSMETLTAKDRSNDIKGSQTSFVVMPGYRINNKVTVAVGAQYNTRSMSEDADQKASDEERNNSDSLETVQARVLYKPTRYSDNGIADVRLQARVYRDQNDIFMRRYGSDGNYQFRAFFGRPLFGKFSINKYTSYVRYKEYFVNEYASEYTRLSETRFRISPTYTPIKGMDFSVSVTYNRYLLKGNSSPDGKNYSEQVEIGPSARYQMGRYAILFWSDLDVLETNKFGSLAENEKAGAEVTYAINLSAFL